ncbi:MAG: prepilin-type N-terminal cleavage/methylation domain-containing protein [Alphaproteobacteria bacterium]|nr:prepilin-type N-terminal cleavage/methylation domain-containing protein [Alphaproteobacteria bacterium]
MSGVQRREADGFSLLELLLALVLLGLLVSLVLPRLDRLYLSFLFWLDQDRIEREIASLSGRAYLEGKALRLSTWPPPTLGSAQSTHVSPPVSEPTGASDEAVRPTLPEGWRVMVEPSILFRPDGVCSGGEAVIQAGDIIRRLRLEPPRCRLK